MVAAYVMLRPVQNALILISKVFKAGHIFEFTFDLDISLS